MKATFVLGFVTVEGFPMVELSFWTWLIEGSSKICGPSIFYNTDLVDSLVTVRFAVFI
jgi:hypothetical protein